MIAGCSLATDVGNNPVVTKTKVGTEKYTSPQNNSNLEFVEEKDIQTGSVHRTAYIRWYCACHGFSTPNQSKTAVHRHAKRYI